MADPITLPPLPERPWRMFCTKCGRTTPLDAKDVQHSPPGSPFVSHFGVCPCGYQALAEQAPWTADQLRARDLEIVRLVLEDARPEPDCRTCAKRSALHIRTVCALPRKQPCTNGDRYEPLPPVRLWRKA